MAKPYTVGKDKYATKQGASPFRTVTEYSVDADGNLVSSQVLATIYGGGPRSTDSDYILTAAEYSRQNLVEAQAKSKKIIDAAGKEKIERERNALADQIRGLTSEPVGTGFSKDLERLSAARNYGASDLGTKLNFQVSDQQIVDDYNTSKLLGINSIIDRGNTQIAGINERLKTARDILSQLPADSSQRKSSEKLVEQLNNDLNSVTGAVTSAQKMKTDFKPITVDATEGLKEITSFRNFAMLPEERASQQLFQIDPESYQTSVTLGQKYRQMAETPIGATTTPETEALRQRIEGEAMAQLSLGAQLGAEEQRAYQQAARGAQTARGNIFGVAPAVEEAVTTGAAGEQRKLARYGAAAQFLGSGQTTGDALKADLAFRDALQQNRLGAASDFIAGGPSIYNLSQARTGQQQNAFQNYIQANQALPGGFNQQPSTAAPFYSAVDQSIPVALTNAFANLYGSQANYLSSTYGAQVGAISRQQSGAQQAAFDLAILGGISGIYWIVWWTWK
jgi:phosphotransferase system IIB component